MEDTKEEFGQSEEQEETQTEETLDTKEESTEETTEESTEETQDASEKADDKETEEAETTEAEVVDLEAAIDEDTRSNEQKRIDKITAQKYQAEAREEALKAELKALKEAKTEKHERVYTEAELDQAASNTASDEGKTEAEKFTTYDNISKERIKNMERKLEARYAKAQEDSQKAQTQTSEAWNNVEVWYKKQLPPEYRENKDFNVLDNSSKLFKMAKSLYADDELGYKKTGDMLRAVTDAFFALINSKGAKKEFPGEKKLKRKLAKEKRKTALAGTGFKKEVTKIVPKKSKGKLDDYFEERKQGFKVPEIKIAK